MKHLFCLAAAIAITMSASALTDGPTYLDDINSNPQAGPFLDAIETFKNAGKVPNPVWYLYAYRTEIGLALGHVAQPVIRGGNAISPGMRELIGAYISTLNKVDFCSKIHGYAAASLLGNEKFVSQVLKNPETSSLTEKDKALFRYARKLTVQTKKIGEQDTKILKDAGWSDEAIYYLVSTTAMYNFFNRWVTGTGVKPLSDDLMRQFGQGLAANGYSK